MMVQRNPKKAAAANAPVLKPDWSTKFRPSVSLTAAIIEQMNVGKIQSRFVARVYIIKNSKENKTRSNKKDNKLNFLNKKHSQLCSRVDGARIPS